MSKTYEALKKAEAENERKEKESTQKTPEELKIEEDLREAEERQSQRAEISRKAQENLERAMAALAAASCSFVRFSTK
mgnify:CR=1 FL=1